MLVLTHDDRNGHAQRVRHLIALVVMTVTVAVAPAADARESAANVVSRNGRVGPLQAGTSTTKQVIRFAGRPRRETFETVENGAVMRFYTYNCGHGRKSTYVFDADDRLANFLTTCHSWRTANGTRVGDDQQTAERNEGKAATPIQCGSGGPEIERTGRAWLYVSFVREDGLVRGLAVAGRNGVLGC